MLVIVLKIMLPLAAPIETKRTCYQFSIVSTWKTVIKATEKDSKFALGSSSSGPKSNLP